MANEIVKREETGLVKFTALDFFKEFKPVNCMKLYRDVNTLPVAVKCETYSLATINKMFSREIAVEYLKLWIIDLNEYMNMSRSMTEMQIEQTAILLYDEYYYLNLSEMNLVFTKIKKGAYGDLYNLLNGAKIMSCFALYNEERTAWYFEAELQKHNQIKQSEKQAKRFFELKKK